MKSTVLRSPDPYTDAKGRARLTNHRHAFDYHQLLVYCQYSSILRGFVEQTRHFSNFVLHVRYTCFYLRPHPACLQAGPHLVLGFSSSLQTARRHPPRTSYCTVHDTCILHDGMCILYDGTCTLYDGTCTLYAATCNCICILRRMAFASFKQIFDTDHTP